ncbi:MAG: hypothetical protein A3H35_11165 [Betaproteobacteria bacterium RIFCSPLOWO2_02_FULL_62_17]|nr:MAG: hypothetical protein A3H35_11165 [Betaproteobacteria bacterium RIFCSPLOWO2_02_FULL_62_17]
MLAKMQIAAFVAIVTAVTVTASLSAHAAADAVFVTATRFPSRVDAIVSDVTVIEKEEIQRAGQASLAELLQTQPGIEIVTNGGMGQPSGISIRGANVTQTLVIVDGLRIGSATAGQAALEHISLAQIERIEILRGPASSLYGADALGGVVQIFTHRGSGPPKANVSFGYGTYGTAQAGAGVTGQSGDTRYALQLGMIDSKGFSSLRPDSRAFIDPFNTDADGYRNRSLNAWISQRLNADHELGLNVLWSDARVHFDGLNCDATGFVCTSNYDNRVKQTLANYAVNLRSRLSSSWLSTLRVGRATDDYTNFSLDPVTPAETQSVFRTDQDQVSWQNDISMAAGRLMLAYEDTRQRVQGTTKFTAASRDIRSFVAGYQGEFGPHILQASGRRDQNSQFGQRNSGSLGYGYQFAPRWRAGASLGTAFRTPTFNDLYFPFDPALFYGGNPALKPESARNQELSLRYESTGMQVSAVYYRNKISDLITVQCDPVTFNCSVFNVNRATLEGWTLSGAGDVGRWRLKASLDLQDPRNDVTGRQLTRRAREHGTATATRQFGVWQAGAEALFSGARFDNPANTIRMKAYTVFNLFANYRLSGGWSLFSRLNNVTNEKYEISRNFATPATSVFIGVRYQQE